MPHPTAQQADVGDPQGHRAPPFATGEAGPIRGHQLGPASVADVGLSATREWANGRLTKQRLTTLPEVRPKW